MSRDCLLFLGIEGRIGAESELLENKDFFSLLLIFELCHSKWMLLGKTQVPRHITGPGNRETIRWGGGQNAMGTTYDEKGGN
jgi:hypothetical protein